MSIDLANVTKPCPDTIGGVDGSDDGLAEIVVEEGTDLGNVSQTVASQCIGHQEIVFEDSYSFYAMADDLCTDGAPFSIKLPRMGLEEFPARLKLFLNASPCSSGEATWQKAFASLEESLSSGRETEKAFTVHLYRNFDTQVWDEWYDWDRDNRDWIPTGPVAPPFVAGLVLTKWGASSIFAMRYGLSWARGQDRRRWRYMSGVAATGAGAGAAGGAGIGALIGGVVGLTVGVITSGTRKAQVVANHTGTVITCL